MSFLAAIAFDPHIRGVLVVMVGVVVLFGSVYLIVATNTGLRNGFLIAGAALMGWCFSLGLFWWIYGIGMIGQAPSWMEREVNFDRSSSVETEQLQELPSRDAGELPDPVQLLRDHEQRNPQVREDIEATEGEGFVPRSLTQVVTLVPELKDELDEELNGWRILPESDTRRGEAAAAADAFIAEEGVFGQNATAASYTLHDVFLYGGKAAAEPEAVEGETGALERAWNRVVSAVQVQNPTLYAAITVQRNIDVEVPLGAAPPPPQVNEEASTVTVVLQRNLGNLRVVPALFTLFTGILFFAFVWMLHTRDRRATETREAWTPAKVT